jgi:thymidylate kinase
VPGEAVSSKTSRAPRRAVLVTVSGIVGSGKSTTARTIVDTVTQGGKRTATLWHFRNLPCFRFTTGPGGGRRSQPDKRYTESEDRPDYRPRRLSATRAIGYLGRILLFRAFLARHAHSADVIVTNRYFYDNLAHFNLSTWRERVYARALGAFIPVPDIGLLLVASPKIIAERRPTYSADYVEKVGEGYRRLPDFFPRLVTVHTDREGPPLHELVSELLL